MVFRNGASRLRVWIRGVDKVERYYRAELRLLAVARREGLGASVKAICDDAETADLWVDRWALHGVLVERLIGNVCFFELSANQLHRMPDLPAPRTGAPGAASVIVRPN